jgi:hypothetical protein
MTNRKNSNAQNSATYYPSAPEKKEHTRRCGENRGKNTRTMLHFANRAEKNSTLLAVVSKAVDLMRTILID